MAVWPASVAKTTSEPFPYHRRQTAPHRLCRAQRIIAARVEDQNAHACPMISQIAQDPLRRDRFVFHIAFCRVARQIDTQQVVRAFHFDAVTGVVDEGKITRFDGFDELPDAAAQVGLARVEDKVDIARAETGLLQSWKQRGHR